MADLEFVDPSTGAVLGAHAFGVVPAGTASSVWALRLRYKWGQSGSGLNQNALILSVSEDGGVTYSTSLAEFTLRVGAVVNVPGDPLFTGATTSARRTNRLDLPALRAGCAYDLELAFSPTLRTGTATQAYRWKLEVQYNESWRAISDSPTVPVGVLSGLGRADVSEWVTAPTLANGTDEVTLGASSYVHAGVLYSEAGGAVALSQDDGDSVTLSATEEYVAVLSAGASGITTTKGSLAPAGTAVAPAYPTGELPLAVVRVPFGGVIVTSTLLALSGRCLVADAGGLDVTVQPGRAVMPGYYLTPGQVRTLTLPDDATTTVYLDSTGTPSIIGGVPLAEVVTAAGDISSVTDLRRLLGLEPILISVPGDEAVADARASVYIPFPWAADTGEIPCRVPSTGATGSTAIDVELDGTGIASGTVAAQATSGALTFTALSGEAGWLTVDFTAITSGGTRAADFSVVLWVARRG